MLIVLNMILSDTVSMMEYMYLHRLHRAVPGGGLTSVMIQVCTYDGVPVQTSQSSTWWWSYLCHDPGVYI